MLGFLGCVLGEPLTFGMGTLLGMAGTNGLPFIGIPPLGAP